MNIWRETRRSPLQPPAKLIYRGMLGNALFNLPAAGQVLSRPCATISARYASAATWKKRGIRRDAARIAAGRQSAFASSFNESPRVIFGFNRFSNHDLDSETDGCKKSHFLNWRKKVVTVLNKYPQFYVHVRVQNYYVARRCFLRTIIISWLTRT